MDHSGTDLKMLLLIILACVLGSSHYLRSGARLFAEVTLVLILFADASHVCFKRLKQSFMIPLRMLLIGMPLTIGLGTLFVFWVYPESGLTNK